MEIDFYPEFLPADEAIYLYNVLETCISWKSNKKRSSYFVGNDDVIYEVDYGYGQGPQRKVIHPWTELPILKELQQRVEKVTDETATVAIIQCYPNGKAVIDKIW
jgi:hypothetical protein